MTLNYNHALFRNLQPTMVSALNNAAHEAEAVAQGQRDGAQWESLKGLHEMAGSLEMTGCLALARLSRSLELGVNRVQEAPAQGWTELHERQVCSALAELALGLVPQINRLAERETVFPVRLYPQWRQLLALLNEPVPPPQDLFEPDPDFGELQFGRMDPDYLRKIVTPAVVRLEKAMAALTEADDPETMAGPLASAEEVFQWGGNLHHRRDFHAFWIVARARLAVAQINLEETFRHRAALLAFLSGAHVELKRFGADARRVNHGRILAAIEPLLAPWPATWHHPALAEVRDVFALDAFWAALKDIQADPSAPSIGQQFDQRREEIHQALQQLKEVWEKWGVRTSQSSDVARRLALFAPLGALFPQAGGPELVDRLNQVMTWSLAVPLEETDETTIQELAATLLAVEDALDPRQQGSEELLAQIKLQNQRLEALMVPGRPLLARLPVVRWGNVRRRREVQDARRHSLQQVAADLSRVEKSLDEIMREEIEPKDIDATLKELMRAMEVGTAALRTLRLPLHARIQAALLDHLDGVVGRTALLEDPEEHARLASVIPPLLEAVLAEANGQADTDEMLAGVAATFLNRPLVGRTDAPALDGEDLNALPSPSNRLDVDVAESDGLAPDSMASLGHEEKARAVSASALEHADPLEGVEVPVETALDHEIDLDIRLDGHQEDQTATVGEGQTISLEEPPASVRATETITPSIEPVATAEEEPSIDLGELDAPAQEQVPSVPVAVGDQLRSAQGYLEQLDESEPDQAGLAEIYFAELHELVSQIRLARDLLSQDPHHEDALDTLRRAFHSIKGSGRLVKLMGLGEIGFWGEGYIRGIQARGEGFGAEQDYAVAMLAQTVLLTAEALAEDGQTELYGQSLWGVLYPEQAQAELPVAPASSILADAETSEEMTFHINPWEEDASPSAATDLEIQAAYYDDHTGTAPAEAQVPLDYDAVPVEPVSPPLAAEEAAYEAGSYWRVPEAEADVRHHAEAAVASAREPSTPDAPETAHRLERSALQEFLADPESKEAVDAEWRQRKAQLQQLQTDGNVGELGLVAHSLRALAQMFEWHEWADEFADVEALVSEGGMEPAEVEGWAERWLWVIGQAQAGVTPEWTGGQDDLDATAEETVTWGAMETAEHPEAIDDVALNDVAVPDEPRPSTENDLDSEKQKNPEVDRKSEEPSAPEAASPEPPFTRPSSVTLDPLVDEAVATLAREPADADPLWEEVFAAFDQLMTGGKRLGEALMRLAEQRDSA